MGKVIYRLYKLANIYRKPEVREKCNIFVSKKIFFQPYLI